MSYALMIAGMAAVTVAIRAAIFVLGNRIMFPPLARQARIQGSVVLQAVIAKDGTIQNLRLVQGHPMLAPSAIEAVKPRA